MNRINVKTGALRVQANEINRQAHRYGRRFSALEECMSWVRQQEFDGAEEMYHTLRWQQEEMMRQKRDLLLLSEGLQRICDKYEKTERKLAEKNFIFRIVAVKIWGLDDLLPSPAPGILNLIESLKERNGE